MHSLLVQIIDGNSFLLKAIGSGLWPALVVLSELVQTLILADFWCASTSYIAELDLDDIRCKRVQNILLQQREPLQYF